MGAAKHLKEDWFIVLHQQLWLKATLLKSFIVNTLKCKARLKTKIKCVCVTMCSLVMSPFSRDYMKMEIEQLKYQQCLN